MWLNKILSNHWIFLFILSKLSVMLTAESTRPTAIFFTCLSTIINANHTTSKQPSILTSSIFLSTKSTTTSSTVQKAITTAFSPTTPTTTTSTTTSSVIYPKTKTTQVMYSSDQQCPFFPPYIYIPGCFYTSTTTESTTTESTTHETTTSTSTTDNVIYDTYCDIWGCTPSPPLYTTSTTLTTPTTSTNTTTTNPTTSKNVSSQSTSTTFITTQPSRNTSTNSTSTVNITTTATTTATVLSFSPGCPAGYIYCEAYDKCLSPANNNSEIYPLEKSSRGNKTCQEYCKEKKASEIFVPEKDECPKDIVLNLDACGVLDKETNRREIWLGVSYNINTEEITKIPLMTNAVKEKVDEFTCVYFHERECGNCTKLLSINNTYYITYNYTSMKGFHVWVADFKDRKKCICCHNIL